MKWILLLTAMIGYGQSVDSYLPKKELLTKKFLEKISKPYRGQTQFANQTYHRRYSELGRARAGASKATQREIQESDVFKIGAEGHKELFLLNSYRGFQVISFEDGPELPKIKARLPIYNNYNSEMYYLKDAEMVLVVNSEWSYGRSYMGSNYVTNIYQIDVSNTSELKLISEKSIGGHLESSRLVGDVLYTVTENYSSSERKAQITSLKIEKAQMKKINQEQLHSKDMYIGKMNVFQNGSNYYVLSSRGNWSMNKGYVDLFDISSEDGKIVKVQTMKTKGRISERSQMFMHSNHIVTVSNYREKREPTKIAIEAFEVHKSETILESIENKRLILKDTKGLHANLQDVRVSGDLLYTFWVPANEIDPFDLIDMSNLKEGFNYLGRLHFDGWISKSFPVKYKNKDFIIGLGWIVPGVGENRTRYPQAKIFEIKKTVKGIKHIEVDTLIFDEEKVWAQLNGEDKNFEILPISDSSFEILFPVSYRIKDSWRSKSGAKLVKVDLKKRELSAGAKIQGESNWLKRVFSNVEIGKINSFSDKELVTFSNNKNKSGFLNTLSVLELARNIIDFKIISKTMGVQVVQTNEGIEFRKVKLSNSDAEKNEVLEIRKIKGKVKWSRSNGNVIKLILAKAIMKKLKHGHQREVVESLRYVDFNFRSMKVNEGETIKFTKEQMDKGWFSLEAHTLNDASVFEIKSHNEMYLLSDGDLKKISKDRSCSEFMGDKNSYEAKFYTAGGKFFAYNVARVQPTDLKTRQAHGVMYKFGFIKKIDLIGNNLSCKKAAVNIPGYPLDLANNYMITGGSGYTFFPFNYEMRSSRIGRGRGYYPRESKTYSLKIGKKNATLVDYVEKSIATNKYGEGKYLTLTSSEGRLDLWRITKRGEIISRPRYLSETINSQLVKTFKKDKDLYFITKSKKLISMYKIAKRSSQIEKLKIESAYDQSKKDGNAEYVYGFRNVTLDKRKTKAYISQGMYGLLEISIN